MNKSSGGGGGKGLAKEKVLNNSYNTAAMAYNKEASTKSKKRLPFDMFKAFSKANLKEEDYDAIKESSKINVGLCSKDDMFYAMWDYIKKNSIMELKMWEFQAWMYNAGEEGIFFTYFTSFTSIVLFCLKASTIRFMMAMKKLVFYFLFLKKARVEQQHFH